MRIKSSLLLITLTALFGSCNDGLFSPRYDEQFDRAKTKTQAEHQVLSYLVAKYQVLPVDRYYKVAYSYEQVVPNSRTSHAIWYDKTRQRLGLEYDKPDGPSCYWDSVSFDALEKVVDVKQGLEPLDSLARPESGRMYQSCIR